MMPSGTFVAEPEVSAEAHFVPHHCGAITVPQSCNSVVAALRLASPEFPRRSGGTIGTADPSSSGDHVDALWAPARSVIDPHRGTCGERIRDASRWGTPESWEDYLRYVGEPQRGPRRVRVAGRSDIGEVIDEGRNIGSVYCVAVHFPDTGEVILYDKRRVNTID